MTLPFLPDMGLHPEVLSFFDPATSKISHIVADPDSSACAIIDPVLDFDPASGRTATTSADALIAAVTARGWRVDWLLETHVHADHLSGARRIQARLGGKIAISRAITTVQGVFGEVFGEGESFARDGSQFDVLLDDGDVLMIGTMAAYALHTPGHTPACMSFVIGDAAFVGDTLFMPDQGTARADFPGGDARQLYRSIRTLLELPPQTRLFMCHDYAPGGRPFAWESTVAEERAANIHVADTISEDAFVAMREARDATLGMPRLILPSLQVNMRAGTFPEPDAAGRVYLKLPVDLL
jgi:glyoxylase-like metal-dependent hydrolase (beta-lactamase superfamily II)